MSAIIVDADLQLKFQHNLSTTEIRNPEGFLIGQFIPDQDFIKRTMIEETQSIPVISREERAQAIEAMNRGECLTTDQMVSRLREAYRTAQETKK